MIGTIRSLRLRVRATQGDVSKFLGYGSVTTYQKIETGISKKVLPGTVKMLAEMFQVTPEEIKEAIEEAKAEAEAGQPVKQTRASLPRDRKHKSGSSVLMET